MKLVKGWLSMNVLMKKKSIKDAICDIVTSFVFYFASGDLRKKKKKKEKKKKTIAEKVIVIAKKLPG